MSKLYGNKATPHNGWMDMQASLKDKQQLVDTPEPSAIDQEREAAFYAAALDAFYATSLEYDKGIFTLSAGGLGLLVTLLTTTGITSHAELVAYLIGIGAFTVSLLLLLWTFRLNKKHIVDVVAGDDKLSTKQLRILELASMIVFGIGIACAAVVGDLTAINSYNTKVKAMADNKSETTKHQINESFVGVGKLRPQVSTGITSNATQNKQPVTPPTQSSNSPSSVSTNSSTPKGK